MNSPTRNLQNNPVTHAGGIVFRQHNNLIEFLLVGPKIEIEHEWLLPKGHIEEGESAEDGAVREVREETGVIVQVVGTVGDLGFYYEGRIIRVRFFLMKYIGEETGKENRRKTWEVFKSAISKLSFEETKSLLKDAEKLRQTLCC